LNADDQPVTSAVRAAAGVLAAAALAMTLALEVIFGMAKMMPMSRRAFEKSKEEP